MTQTMNRTLAAFVASGLLAACEPPLPTETVVVAGAPRDVSVAADVEFVPDAIVARLSAQLLDGVPSTKAYEFGFAGVSFADTERFFGSITSYRDHCGIALDIDMLEVDSKALGDGYLAAWRTPAGGAYEVYGQCPDMNAETWGDDPSSILGGVPWRFAVASAPSGVFDDDMASILKTAPGYTDLIVLIDDVPYVAGPMIVYRLVNDRAEYLDPTKLVALEDGMRLYSYGWGHIPLEAL